MSDRYPKSMPSLGATQNCPRALDWQSEIADKVAKDLQEGIPVEQVGPLRVTGDGVEATFQITDARLSHITLTEFGDGMGHVSVVGRSPLRVIALDDLPDTSDYDDLFLDGTDEDHYPGCASTRNRPCTCEYLGQWL